MPIDWDKYVWYPPTFDSLEDYPACNALVGCIDTVTEEIWYSYVVLPYGCSYYR